MSEIDKDINVPNKNDAINRRSAVDAVLGVIPYDEYWLEQVNKAIEALPSAQLAQDLPNGCTDTISRQAAIDANTRAVERSSE